MSGWRNRSTYDHGGVSSPCATVGLERGTLRFSVPSSPRAGASLRNPKCDAFRDATSLVTARHVTDRHRATPRLTPMHSSGASGFLISGLGAIALPLRDPQCHPVILRSGNLGTEGPFKSGRPDHFPQSHTRRTDLAACHCDLDLYATPSVLRFRLRLPRGRFRLDQPAFQLRDDVAFRRHADVGIVLQHLRLMWPASAINVLSEAPFPAIWLWPNARRSWKRSLQLAGRMRTAPVCGLG